MNLTCACCKIPLSFDDVVSESELYQSHHTLCETCGEREEQAVDEAGTNDLPELLKTYT